jgi:uncharacterized membrane protein
MNNKFFPILFSLLLFFSLFLPAQAFSQENSPQEEVFKGKIIEISNPKTFDNLPELKVEIKIKGTEDDWKDKEIIVRRAYEETNENKKYIVGDKVLVLFNPTIKVQGGTEYYIIDHLRNTHLYFLAILFAIITVLVGRFKGLRSLLALLFTFLILIKFIIPKIITGANPLLISILGSFFILLFIIYLTEGLNRKSHLAVVSILLSLVITGILAIIFTKLAHLTGSTEDEAMYLITSLKDTALNFKNLLLAGIIIGSLGILDDVVISQIATVEEIRKANSQLNSFEVFKRSLKVGISHISSMTNTLFLVYAGASLPLLILFTLKEPPFSTFSETINNEVIATEITKSLIGSIGLILAVPIATFLASYFLNKKRARPEPKLDS